jgi:hypothetical protein
MARGTWPLRVGAAGTPARRGPRAKRPVSRDDPPSHANAIGTEGTEGQTRSSNRVRAVSLHLVRAKIPGPNPVAPYTAKTARKAENFAGQALRVGQNSRHFGPLPQSARAEKNVELYREEAPRPRLAVLEFRRRAIVTWSRTTVCQYTSPKRKRGKKRPPRLRLGLV